MPLHAFSAQPVADADGWTDDPGTWTRTANTTFTTEGDTTAQFAKGTRLKVTDTTTKYFVVVSSSFAAGTTTVTITGGSDYTLAANPTARWYSYAVSPQGYPGFFNYTVVWTGFSAAPTSTGRFSVNGTTCTYQVAVSATGTSNATSMTVSLPINLSSSTGSTYHLVWARNNSSDQTTPGMWEGAAGASTATLYLNATGAAWTSSNTKHVKFMVSYEI